LAITLPRAIPAPHKHRDLFFATDEWREVALSRAAATAARPDYSEKRDWLRHALEFVAAALLDDEETSDLALHARCHNDRTRLG
jgi:hypothetical protein